MNQEPHHQELVCAYRLDGKGGGTALDWVGVDAWTPAQGAIWVHLDCTHEATDAWLRGHSGLDTHVIDGLLAAETRPRCEWYDDGILMVLRGVNLNPGAEPEDMVSVRMWIDRDRVISTRVRPLLAVEDIREQLAIGRGPVSTGHLVARLAATMTERMAPAIEELGDAVAVLEDTLIGSDGKTAAGKGATKERFNPRAVRHKLIDLRRTAISLRRYVAPQRDALNYLSQLDEPWLDQRVRGRLRETVDRVTRIVEELDEVRERAAVVQDELMNRISQRMERNMLALTIVATIILPLTFVTGLLGINVAGIPGAESPWAFAAVCLMLAVLAGIEVWVLRRLGWF